MHQRGSLKRVPRPLARKLPLRCGAKLVVNHSEQMIGACLAAWSFAVWLTALRRPRRPRVVVSGGVFHGGMIGKARAMIERIPRCESPVGHL